jgi:hypothetical protein
MTVSSTISRKTYAGDDATTSFGTSPMVFFDDADLVVYVVTTATGAVVATLVLDTDYTVSGGDGSTGTLDLSAGSSPYGAPASGQTLVIVRSLAITQDTDFVNNDSSDAEVAEDTIDRLTMICQELDQRLDRSIVFADSDVSEASTVLPTPEANALLAWNSAADALENKVAADLDLATVSVFIETLLDDADAATARTTLGAAASADVVLATLIDAKGDLLVGTAADTTARKAVGTDGYILKAQSGTTDGLQYLPPQAGFALENGYLDWSVAANVLTVAIKTEAGTDPSATDPVYVVFRSVTPGTGSLVRRKLTAATSIAINDTAFLGTANDIAFRLWAVAFDDGGTVRLGLINCLSGTAPSFSLYPLAGWGIASSTQEADGSDSAGVFYTAGAAVTSKAYATLGFASWESGLTAAGTWSAAPTRAQLFGLGMPLPGHRIQLARHHVGDRVATATTIPDDDTIPQVTEGAEMFSVTLSPSSAANLLRSSSQCTVGNTGGVNWAQVLFRDGGADGLAAVADRNGANEATSSSMSHLVLAGGSASTEFTLNLGPLSASTLSLNAVGATRRFGGVHASYLEIEEIMA